jgi:hypothetical protein
MDEFSLVAYCEPRIVTRSPLQNLSSPKVRSPVLFLFRHACLTTQTFELSDFHNTSSIAKLVSQVAVPSKPAFVRIRYQQSTSRLDENKDCIEKKGGQQQQQLLQDLRILSLVAIPCPTPWELLKHRNTYKHIVSRCFFPVYTILSSSQFEVESSSFRFDDPWERFLRAVKSPHSPDFCWMAMRRRSKRLFSLSRTKWDSENHDPDTSTDTAKKDKKDKTRNNKVMRGLYEMERIANPQSPKLMTKGPRTLAAEPQFTFFGPRGKEYVLQGYLTSEGEFLEKERCFIIGNLDPVFLTSDALLDFQAHFSEESKFGVDKGIWYKDCA